MVLGVLGFLIGRNRLKRETHTGESERFRAAQSKAYIVYQRNEIVCSFQSVCVSILSPHCVSFETTTTTVVCGGEMRVNDLRQKYLYSNELRFVG